MFTSFLRPKVTLGYCLLTLFVATPAWSDDIEIYSNSSGGTSSANIVFIIDNSQSMNKSVDGSSSGLANDNANQRLRTVKTKFNGIIDEIATLNAGDTGTINAAVMRFNGSAGGYFITPMEEVTNANKQANFKDKVEALTPVTFTPLSETLYEAARYFRGENETYGIELNDTGVLVNAQTEPTADQYDSPITAPTPGQCSASNHIVLLTDGSPYDDGGADEQINNWINPAEGAEDVCGGSDNCLDELAGFLYDNPQKLDQNVITHTIAFGTGGTMDLGLLRDTAAASDGEGLYRSAANSMELATAFEDILNSISMYTKPDTMAAPALTVNAFNRLTHTDEVYFSLFKPANSKSWPGNVKGFRLGTDPDNPTRVTLLDDSDPPVPAIVDGAISDTAKSLWSSVVDGADVTKGGAASKMTTTRKIYTYTTSISATDDLVNGIADGDLKTLAKHHLIESNTDIDTNLLFPETGALPTGVTEAELRKWGSGLNADGTARLAMGDPLHSQPAMVTYSSTLSVLFVATNEGYLHAIDTDDGVEKFAFMPQALLKNLYKQKYNTTTDKHLYGLDGSITTRIEDADGDGIIEDGDHVYLYVGMRRGGNNYYMLDVTDPDEPQLKWIIRGGIAGTDYAELGQTWSRPTLGKLKFSGGDKDVLVFGGGYDTQEDATTPPATNSIGRAIFIADADSGALLWSADTSDLGTMAHSIPSDVRVLDVDLDGYIDRLYVGDLHAQIFRVDISNGEHDTASASVVASIGRIANLGGTGSHDRRFYNAPDVALTKNPNLPGAYLSINIGSGYRAHPLDTDVNDRFYSIRDTDVIDAPATYELVDEDDLYDATGNTIGQGSGTDPNTAKIALYSDDKKGWYVTLEGSGEKVLAEAMTFDNQVFFATYTPQTPAEGSCSALPGLGKLYAVSLFDATPVRNTDNAIELTKEDRLIKELDKGGIPSPPTVVFPPGKKPTLLVGNESLDSTGLELTLQKSYWRPEE